MKYAALFSLLTLSLFYCKTPVTKNGATTGNGSSSSTFVEDKQTGLMKNAKWGTSLKEGWLDEGKAQALISKSGSVDKEAMTKEARERLAWLLLLDSYDLTRADKNLAARLARSKVFRDFGSEKVFEHNEKGKAFVIVQRSASNLKKNWQNIMSRVEAKEPRLSSLRRKK